MVFIDRFHRASTATSWRDKYYVVKVKVYVIKVKVYVIKVKVYVRKVKIYVLRDIEIYVRFVHVIFTEGRRSLSCG